MSSSSDDLSKFVVKTEVTPEKAQQIADGLAAGEKGGGTIFEPMEAVAAGLRAGNMMAQFLKLGVIMLARGIIMPTELVLRHSFGERYFNAFVIGGFLFVYFVARVGFTVFPSYCHFVLGITLLLLIWNRIMCFWRDRKGIYWHSYYEGKSRLRIPELDKFLAKHNFRFDATKLVIEPVVVYIVSLFGYATPDERVDEGFTIICFNPVVSYFQIVAVVMFVYQLYCYLYRREQYLNEKDNQIEAEVRDILNAPDAEPGLETHKGLAYIIMGGKKSGEPEKDCPNPDI